MIVLAYKERGIGNGDTEGSAGSREAEEHRRVFVWEGRVEIRGQEEGGVQEGGRKEPPGQRPHHRPHSRRKVRRHRGEKREARPRPQGLGQRLFGGLPLPRRPGSAEGGIRRAHVGEDIRRIDPAGHLPRHRGLRAPRSLPELMAERALPRRRPVQEHGLHPVGFPGQKVLEDHLLHEVEGGEGLDGLEASAGRHPKKRRKQGEFPLRLLEEGQDEGEPRHIGAFCLRPGQKGAGLLDVLPRQHAGRHLLRRLRQEMRRHQGRDSRR